MIEPLEVNEDTLQYTTEDERRRRVDALRKAMDESGHDALVIVGRGDARFRGRVFYVSDILEVSGDTFVVMPRDGEMRFIATPVVGLARARLTTWIADRRMSATPGAEVGRALAELGLDRGQIGIVGMKDAIALGHFEELRNELPHASLTDATPTFEHVRRVKSPDEIENLRETSAAFRKVFTAIEAELRPGITERDILAEATRVARIYGCRDVKAAISTTPFRAVGYGSDRRIGRDDIVMIWIESPGRSGYWLEFRRCYSFGPPPNDVVEFWTRQVEATQAALAVMKPGARASAVVEAVDLALGGGDFWCGEPDSTYALHGIGTDAIEGFVYPADNVSLLENEVVSYHPSVKFADERQALRLRFIGMTDNILIAADGAERLTYETDTFVEL